jgi:hypothetical protein
MGMIIEYLSCNHPCDTMSLKYWQRKEWEWKCQPFHSATVAWHMKLQERVIVIIEEE